MADLLLGIDGGGSKTVVLLADHNGAVLGRGVAGGSNVRAKGLEAAAAAISAAVAAAYAQAGIVPRPATVACLGLAGAGRPAEQAMVQAWATQTRLAERTMVFDDASLVLAAGLPERWGIALIAGTGSIALGRDSAGATGRAGGWGPLLGDEGSGADIARAALRAVCRAADGRGPATELLPAFLAHWRLANPSALIPFVYEASAFHTMLAEVPPLVVAAAARGDDVARELLTTAGHELAVAGMAVAGQLALGPSLPLALAGGLLVNSELVRETVLHDFARHGFTPAPVLVPEPAVGALRLAADLVVE
jgi:N-acetylglucosamine kinase-like BadF-type ATPase